MIRHQDGEMGRESEAAAVAEEEEEEVRERKRRMERAPVDDVCPICFGDFVYPCRGPCGHWYCGGCILLYWNHVAALQPCKCPMCSQKITRLIPEASLNCCVDDDVLENVKKYNLLFVGGMYGFFRKVIRLPFLMKRIFDEGNPHRYHILRFFVTTLGVIYCTSQCNFLPKAMSSVQAFDVAFTVLVLILQIVGYFYRWLQRQQARRLQLL